ncbi:MAG: LAGLIDADG family homing endonuclease [Candidatus Woesearchaeota archaeon]
MRGRINNITKKELGYIIGLYIGDGYSNYNKNDRHYRVEFHLNSERDKDILDYTKLILSKMGFKFFLLKDKRGNSIKIYVNSKELMLWINQEVKLLKDKRLTKDCKLGLLSGFIDAEGWVKKGDIVVTQKNKQIILFFECIAKQFSVAGKLWKTKNYKGKGYVWRLRIPTRFKYLHHNSLKVKRVYGNLAVYHSEH